MLDRLLAGDELGAWRVVESALASGEHRDGRLGGMYAERFDLGRLESPRERYEGVRAYARATRAQVVLARQWSTRGPPPSTEDPRRSGQIRAVSLRNRQMAPAVKRVSQARRLATQVQSNGPWTKG